MSSLQESPENVKQVEGNSSTQVQSDKQPNLLDVEITDENEPGSNGRLRKDL